ncbi:ankyrin repeat and MYND domain-containing protein 1 isoform X2 [Echeneis naucrates]|uniref:ankyrin repeat and MYND domain-containing protein 1 isoform X2 n=1 Tax=Echeneis naucrates TaxID=173247 RepID=UPI0011133604|nr:ankyrin repeat and MYND domain-containing protein 1-like isoform X2 [Echeneis naucrates]
MLSTTCRGVAADPPGRDGGGRDAEPEPEAGRQSAGRRAVQSGEGRREGVGVQEWADGSRYEGEFVNGFKHGKGKYTWRNGEYYEGSFYKDYRHGDGVYCWPTGHKFIGKFYLNRKEGYGQQMFPNGATFQGLYHFDQRFGPGVVSHPDGRQDVGLWLKERLLRFCTTAEESFSLKNLPEYAAYMETVPTTDMLTQPPFLSSSLPAEARAQSELCPDKELQSDEIFIHPPGMESYSTDGDHLLLPPGRRRELDQHFYGELWELDIVQHLSYKRDPLATLPLQVRMQAHIHKHRVLADSLGWDVDAVVSLKREGFGPKGPLEVSSEQMIQHASRGELQAVSHLLLSGLLHPDVADSQGHTALIAATENCHNDVIQLLLDMGADIDKLNCEGMSALAVCHVLYYPFQSLHTALVDTPAKTQGLMSPSACGSSALNNKVEFSTHTPELHDRPQTTDQNNQSHLSDQTEELREHNSHHSIMSNGSEIIGDSWPGINESENPVETKLKLMEEREEDSKGKGSEREVRDREESRHMKYKEEREGEEKKIAEDVGSIKEDVELREEDKGIVQERVTHVPDQHEEERGSVACSIQVLDGHIALGSVQWKGHRAKGAEIIQDKDKELSQNQTFDSACSVSSYNVQVTDKALQHSAEALSRTGIPQCPDTQETVRKMAAMKIEHRVRLKTMKLLLERGADPNIAKVPMPVLFLAVMAADTEAVRRLLLCGARTDIPLPTVRKGLYPLHVAAALPGSAGPKITELLLHTITDPDAQACDHDDIYEPDKILMTSQEPLSTGQELGLKEGGRTALHVACQRDSDYQLEMLVKAGADISMPVMVGDVVGTVVDYAHLSFNQDLRIANTPFHTLNMRERETFKARCQLLNTMRNLLRRTADQWETENLDREQQHTQNGNSSKERFMSMGAGATSLDGPFLSCESQLYLKERRRKPKFCYQCGRSVSVKLTPCSRCHKVLYCSRACKLKAWDERHKAECIRVSASADAIQKRVAFKSERGPRPLPVMFQPKTVSRPLSVKLKSQSPSRPLRVAETASESQVNLKENYSCN